MTHSYATDLKHFDRMLLGGYWGYTSKMWLKHFGSSSRVLKNQVCIDLMKTLKYIFFNIFKVYTETDRKTPKWSNLAWNFYGPFGLKWISVYSSVSNGRISFKHSN